VTASERVRDALEAIEAADGALNAFTALFPERALARAARLDAEVAAGRDPGPLCGVPFAAKNLFDVAGVITRAGAKVTEADPPATRDADLIVALERSGAVLIGVTNMDEFAYGFVTENAHDGPTHNPHDLTRIAGGSSGGSAAAVAAGVVPLALASDTNGSIRVPAALCGIFGLRPTYGSLSSRGAYPFVELLDTLGPFARTAADLTAAYAALAPAMLDEAEPTAPRCAYLGAYFDEGLTSEASAAVTAVGAALGAKARIALPHAREAREAAFLITAFEGGALHRRRLRTRMNDYDPATRDRLLAGALMPGAWYADALRLREIFLAEVATAFEEWDVLLAAATPYPAPPIGQRSIVVNGVETEVRPNVGLFTQPVSLAAVPVVAVPVVSPGALPCGVQLIGRSGSEPLLLALARDLERRGVAGAGEIPAFR
jgi:aspartyl-tRNA(Asn)/glutamyl-tRNA(Gln) amidotransferase subunit A